jgi:hypothetical protein
MSSKKLNYYRVYCSTENEWKYVWGETTPTVCPFNGSHTINENATTILKTVSSKGRTTDDDRQEIALTVMPSHYRACFVARGDDIANGLRGKGERFHIEMTGGSGTGSTVVVQMADPFDLVGGYIMVTNGNKDDSCSMEVFAPASPVVPSPTATGNCNVIYGRITPASGNGAYQVDLSAALNSNVNGTNPLKPRLITQVTPVPAYGSDGVTPNGYYNYSELTGVVSESQPGKGNFNLYAMDLTMIKYITDWPVYRPGGVYEHTFKVNQKGGHLIPHWKFRIGVTRASSHDPGDVIEYFWGWYMARQFTV